MYKKPYDPVKTAMKAAEAALMVGILPAAMTWLATQSIPTTLEEWKTQWPFLAAGLAGAMIRGLRNWWKNAEHGYPGFLIPLGLSALLAMGCQSTVKTTFSESIGSDGVMSTNYTATSRGEVDATVHSYAGEYGADLTRVAVGQDLTGLTSPAHLEVAATLQAILPSIVQGILGASGVGSGTGGGEAAEMPVLDRLERLEAFIARLREYMPPPQE